MKINIEDIAENKGKIIAEKIIAMYHNGVSFDIPENEVRKEIYDVSFAYATIFFFENPEANLDKEIVDILLFKINTFSKERVKPNKKKKEELLAIVIDWYVLDALFDRDITDFL